MSASALHSDMNSDTNFLMNRINFLQMYIVE